MKSWGSGGGGGGEAFGKQSYSQAVMGGQGKEQAHTMNEPEF